jgi:hypothetical protein
MRSIPVSTDVYAAIWARRKPGQESEDEILRELLGIISKPRSTGGEQPREGAGFYAANVNVRFPEGFEIFRNYRHRDYRAKATGGCWILENDGHSYPSLHKLSWAVVQGHENSWNAWKYRRQDGSVGYINEMRDSGKTK